MNLVFLQSLKYSTFQKQFFFSLLAIIGFSSFHIEIDNSDYPKLIFKEMGPEKKWSEITEKNIKFIDGKNAFQIESYFWELAYILYNRVDLNEVQNTGGKYCSIFGNMDNTIIENYDNYFFASYLSNRDLSTIVQWHNSLEITDIESYNKYLSSLNPIVLERIARNKEFTIEKQYDKVTELFAFYQNALDNGSWVLMHSNH